MSASCPLCNGKSYRFFENSKHSFNKCDVCRGIFRIKEQFLNIEEEKERYKNHISSLEDKGYYEFVSPIIKEVKSAFSKDSIGLDFGCGHTPVLSRHLEKSGFTVREFDPIFHNDASIFSKRYDFIVACEVIEHFYDPIKEFETLYKLLKPEGKLICKTHPYSFGIDFDTWYYKNDPSHVFIYQDETFKWIAQKLCFKSLIIKDRILVFTKK
ncbi:class I SAM-dependent methyltransferase [Lutimonas sp.]|uniref:class I SAM-dependent methyltransferase n=1 Tax=Lutimonas sp. TaxID=1872403 RepID=UPI003D9AE901